MAASYVKHVASSTGANATTLVFTVPAAGVASGNVLVLRAVHPTEGVTLSSIADTKSNTWNLWVTRASTGDAIYLYKCFVGSALVSGDTITVTFATKGNTTGVVDEFTGLDDVEDGENTNAGTSTTPSASFTPANATDLIYAHCGGTIASGDAFTEDADSDGGMAWETLTAAFHGSISSKCGAAYKITTSAATQTYNPTLGTSRIWLVQLGSLKETATASFGPPFSQNIPVRMRL